MNSLNLFVWKSYHLTIIVELYFLRYRILFHNKILKTSFHCFQISLFLLRSRHFTLLLWFFSSYSVFSSFTVMCIHAWAFLCNFWLVFTGLLESVDQHIYYRKFYGNIYSNIISWISQTFYFLWDTFQYQSIFS